ncbi:hypothetical protein ACEXQE_03580 [Herbiconiux sp. P17]|uniref:hypothetical protein n=1 Tax=Herbiconiux wuyangfengii TaxID=3342794 RepID=UPI0035BA969C
MTALDLIGWGGSALLIVSLLQSRMRWLRVLNLIAAIILTAYNLLVPVWPMVAMNAAVAIIDIYYIVRMRSGRDEAGPPAVVPETSRGS